MIEEILRLNLAKLAFLERGRIFLEVQRLEAARRIQPGTSSLADGNLVLDVVFQFRM
jgi:hypothetical protein